jgi:hypothetical protein
MKGLFTFLIVVLEAALAYLWLALGYEAAGRVLIFWLWAETIVFFFMAGLLGHPKFKRPPPNRSPRLVRYFYRAAIAARVLGLAAIDRPVLAGLYLVSVVLVFLMLSSVEKPAAESKEGA